MKYSFLQLFRVASSLKPTQSVSEQGDNDLWGGSLQLLVASYHWLKRFTKRKGYGIHSPYAFNFVTDVVYNTSAYYAYDRLLRDVKRQPRVTIRPTRDYRLLFRITNYFRPTRITSLLTDNTAHKYISAACPTVPIDDALDPDTAAERRVVFLTAEGVATHTLQQLASLRLTDVPPISPVAIVCLDIHRHPKWWQQLRQSISQQGIITFDLHRIGIVISEPHLKRQDYDIAYL